MPALQPTQQPSQHPRRPSRLSMSSRGAQRPAGPDSGLGSWSRPPALVPGAAPVLSPVSASAPFADPTHCEIVARVAALDAEASPAEDTGVVGHAGAEAAAPALRRVSPSSAPPSAGATSPGTQTPPEDAPDAPLDAIELVPAWVVLAAAARRRSAVIDEAAHARRATSPSQHSGPRPSPSPSPGSSPEPPLRGRSSPVWERRAAAPAGAAPPLPAVADTAAAEQALGLGHGYSSGASAGSFLPQPWTWAAPFALSTHAVAEATAGAAACAPAATLEGMMGEPMPRTGGLDTPRHPNTGAVTEAAAGAGADVWAAALAAGGRGLEGFDPCLEQGPPPSAQLWGQDVWEDEACSSLCTDAHALGPLQTRGDTLSGPRRGGDAPAGRRQGPQAAMWGPGPVIESAGQAPRELPWFLEEPELPLQTPASAQPQALAHLGPPEPAQSAGAPDTGAAAAAQLPAAAGGGPGSGLAAFADVDPGAHAHATNIFSPVPRSASALLAAARAEGLVVPGSGPGSPPTRAASRGKNLLPPAEAGAQAGMPASALPRQGDWLDPLNRDTGRPAWVAAAGSAGRPWAAEVSEERRAEGFVSPTRARTTVLARAAWSLPARYVTDPNPALRSVRSADAHAPELQARTLEQRLSAARQAGAPPPGPGEGFGEHGTPPQWAGTSGERWGALGLQRQCGPAWWAEPGFQNPGSNPPGRPSLLARTRTLAGRLLHRARSAERPSPGFDTDPDGYGSPRRGGPARQGPGAGFQAPPPRRSRSCSGDARLPAWLAELQGFDQGWDQGLGEVTAEQLERERDLPRGPLRRAAALPRPSVLDQARMAVGSVGQCIMAHAVFCAGPGAQGRGLALALPHGA